MFVLVLYHRHRIQSIVSYTLFPAPMKTILLLCCFLCSTSLLLAQDTATTKSGKQVVLYNNGTWRALDSLLPAFTKPESAKTKLEFLNGKAAIWVDADVWLAGEEKAEQEDNSGIEMAMASYSHVDAPFSDGEQTFSFDGVGVLVMSLSFAFPEELMETLFFDKMLKEAGDDVQITHKEQRAVNNAVVTVYTISVHKGMEKGMILLYVYTGKSSTVLMFGVARKDIFAKYQADIEGFLNGFEVYE